MKFSKTLKRNRTKSLIRIRISGETKEIQRCAVPKNVAATEAKIANELDGQLKTRYLKAKQAKNFNGSIYATFSLCAKDGSPRYINVLELSKRNTIYIRVVVGQSKGLKRKCVKFNLKQGRYSTVKEAFLLSVDWLGDYLKLDQAQLETLRMSWAAFSSRHVALGKASIPLE
ncbi:hypothetical protein R6242_21560 [Iodobacter sp. CM08]|uniref:hypothetical protein n=1 Tax=Iodobacter sp. CM08 TaxID=3085902 RepID=UPI002981D3F3|nr:hypothetical protein [Iodobacter sp. CM08]MDW5419165.1 hypothetical protein [Iodobacter sp. CM08]